MSSTESKTGSYTNIGKIFAKAGREMGVAMVSSTISTGMLTPANSYMNHFMAGRPFTLQHLFSSKAVAGATNYYSLIVASYVCTFGLNSIVYQSLGSNDGAKFISAAVSGAGAGVVALPFESSALAKQVFGMRAPEYIRFVAKHHGVRGFFYGAWANSLQYSVWASAFLWAPEAMAELLADTTDLSPQSRVQWGAATAGVAYGAITSHLSMSRFVMQRHSLLPGKPPSYQQIFPRILNGEMCIGDVIERVNPKKLALRRGIISGLSLFTFTQVKSACERVIEAFQSP